MHLMNDVTFFQNCVMFFRIGYSILYDRVTAGQLNN